MAVTKRGGKLYLYKRVPKRFAAVEPRMHIQLSLKTDSETVADQKAVLIWGKYIEGWEAKLAGDNDDAELQFAAARDLASSMGFRYMRAEKVLNLPIGDILDRAEAIPMRGGEPDMQVAKALLGTAHEPQISITRALELFWDLSRDQLLGKSEDQIRRWKNPRVKAVKNFVEVIGDKPINEVSRDDMLDFREWWLERIVNEGLTPNSANKDLVHFGKILDTINSKKRLGLDLPLSGLSFKKGEAEPRPPFSEAWIREKILAERALGNLNNEARLILLAMINTGARPSELAALTASQIRLADNVPHISIEPIGRQLKSVNARRVIPLCGVSLEAMRQAPDGFPRYREKPASLSDLVNKYLRNNGLLETPKHSLYSLRHSFEDRQLAADVDERIRRDLMGHSLNRERYGKGASLDKLHAIIQATAL